LDALYENWPFWLSLVIPEMLETGRLSACAHTTAMWL
jgi:hypothetical protein